MSQDQQHLRLLSIFHYVVAGLTALLGFTPSFHLAMGIAMVAGAFPQGGNQGPPPPLWVGWLLIFIAGGVMLMMWAFAVCIGIAGWKLSQRKAYLFCLIVAFAECLIQPFGVILGVFTIIVLFRPSVKELFGVARSPQKEWEAGLDEEPGGEGPGEGVFLKPDPASPGGPSG